MLEILSKENTMRNSSPHCRDISFDCGELLIFLHLYKSIDTIDILHTAKGICRYS